MIYFARYEQQTKVYAHTPTVTVDGVKRAITRLFPKEWTKKVVTLQWMQSQKIDSFSYVIRVRVFYDQKHVYLCDVLADMSEEDADKIRKMFVII